MKRYLLPLAVLSIVFIISHSFYSTVPELEANKTILIGGSPKERLVLGQSVHIPLRLTNPNDIAIYVTAIQVTSHGGSAVCPAQKNTDVIQTTIKEPIYIAAHHTVTLPAEGVAAPTLQFRDLPTNQNGCIGVAFTLTSTAIITG